MKKNYLVNEIMSYRKIVDMCYKYEQIIAESEAAKIGISSASFKEVVYENAGDPYKCQYNELNETIKINSAKLIPWQLRRKWIEERLSLLNDTEFRIIKYKYIVSAKATNAWIARTIGLS